MRNADHPGECAAIASNTQFGRNDDACLQRRQARIRLLHAGDKRKEQLGLILALAHAASRLRKETMIDFEVGVSLSSPALPSGTSTFSSG